MKGWYVDKTTGEPLCWTSKGDKPSLEAAGHLFYAEEMPDGNDPFQKVPYKRGPSGWEKNNVKIAERAASEQAIADKKAQRAVKIASLKGNNNKDIADLAALFE